MKVKEENILGELGSALGKGLLAGLAGTAAITLSQIIEMQITKRGPSEAPVKVASQVTGVQPTSDETKEKVGMEVHFAYGTSWGVARGVLGLLGLKGLPATLVHFGAIWATELLMLPQYDAAPPANEQEPKTLAIDALHHAVYALAAGFAYEALDAGGKHERKLTKLVDHLHVKGLLDKIKS